MSRVTIKLNNQVRKAIQQAKTSLPDIKEIEYTVDWSNFPNSLQLNCILQPPYFLENNHTLAPDTVAFPSHLKKIQQCFLKQGIKFRDFKRNLTLSYSDTIHQQ